jgi:hypothetical protein
MSASFVRCEKNLNEVLTVATLAARKANEATVAPMVGSDGVCFWRESGVRRSVLSWCIWLKFGFSRREDVSTSNLIHKDIFKFCTYSVICKHDAAVNCFCLQIKLHCRQF